jgi:hypothetical protein
LSKYDEIVKRLGRLRPKDFIQWIYPNLELLEEKITFEDREFEKLTHRRVDLLYKVETKKEKAFYFLLEFETGSYTDFSLRFLEYFVLVWRTLGCPVKPVVVFLNSTQTIENNPTEIQCKIEEDVICNFRYTKLILPQENWKALIERKLVALLPLIPITRIPKEEEEEALKRTLQEIEKIPEEKDRAEIAGAFYLIGGYKHKEILRRIIGERLMKDLMESITYQEAVGQGVKGSILKILQFRFNNISEEISSKLATITSNEVLDVLLKHALTAKTLEDFVQLL